MRDGTTQTVTSDYWGTVVAVKRARGQRVGSHATIVEVEGEFGPTYPVWAPISTPSENGWLVQAVHVAVGDQVEVGQPVATLLHDYNLEERRRARGCLEFLALVILLAFTFLAGMLYGPDCVEDGRLKWDCVDHMPMAVSSGENGESEPPEGDSASFAPSEVSLDVSDPNAPPPETLVLEDLVRGAVTAAGIEVGDEGMVSEIALQPDQNTFYSVSRHRYVTTAEGAATVVHLFGPIVDPEGREATTIDLSLNAQSVTTPGPITTTLAIESGGALFLLPAVSELTDAGQPLQWTIPPQAVMPVEEGGAAFDGSQPFRLGVALAVATDQPREALYETRFTDLAASVTLPESGPSSGF